MKTTELVEEVKQKFRQSPHTSIRRVAHSTGLSVGTIWSIASENFHPYKLQFVHQLLPQDWHARLNFSSELLHRLNQHPEFLNTLLFSDEAHFHLHGGVNTHNLRYWSEENPHWTADEPLHSPRVTVWAAIGKPGIVGPFFFEDTVTAASYLEMLNTQFLPAVGNWPHYNSLTFQQDGAPPHWARIVRNFLNERFPNRWIGRGSSFVWPPRSPDLSPMDFFLWGYIKSKVYAAPIPSIEILREKIEAAIQETPQAMVDRSLDACVARLHRCVTSNGGRVESF